MSKVITFGIQKGGAGKTTTAGVTAYMLSQAGYKVLAIDMDSQGNLTEMLTQMELDNFDETSTLHALKSQQLNGCIYKLTKNLHFVPSNDMMATFSRWLYSEYKGDRHNLVLKDTLEDVKGSYDYIIIDTPPALSDQTINALAASDSVVVMFEPSKFCYSALLRFIENAYIIQDKFNPDLNITGILCSLVDNRRADVKALLELVNEEYKDLVFESIVNRRAFIGRLSIMGIEHNNELKSICQEHESFLKELIDRVSEKQPKG